MKFDPYHVPPRYWARLAEEERCLAMEVMASPYHAAGASRKLARVREELVDLYAQLEADQRELARYRALEGL